MILSTSSILFCLIINIFRVATDTVQTYKQYPTIDIAIEKIIVNTLRPRQNGRHLADGISKRIFWDENVRISINISLNIWFLESNFLYISIDLDNHLSTIRRRAFIRTNYGPVYECIYASLRLDKLNQGKRCINTITVMMPDAPGQ